MSEVIDIKPEETPERTIAQIMEEYRTCAQQAGDIQYRIKMFESHLQALNEKMFKLTEEGDQLEKLAHIKENEK